MKTALMLVVMVLFVPALFVVGAAVDALRGHPEGIEFLRDLRALEQRLAADDAPPWAEALGAVLGPAFTLRAVCHVLAAMLGGNEPTLVDNDVGVRNAVASLRTDWSSDAAGRVFSVLLAGALYIGLQPGGIVVPGPEIATTAVRVYVSANILVLATDPIQLLMSTTETFTTEVEYGRTD